MANITEKVPLLTHVKDKSGKWDVKSLMRLANQLDDYRVVDRASEEYLRDIVHYLDVLVDDVNKVPLIHWVEPGGFFLKLLQLGLKPDFLCSNQHSRPESCFLNNQLQWLSYNKAEAFSKCRPDLKAKNYRVENEGFLSLQEAAAAHDNRAMRWKVSEDGFPSLALLAHDQHWYAVRNLCRRRVISSEEKEEVYNGKTAIECIRHHRGPEGLEEEMQYLLQIYEVPVKKVGEGDKDELKEMLLLNITKTQEEFEKVEQEVAELKNEMLAELKKEGKKELPNELVQEVKELKKQLQESNKDKEALKMKVDVLSEQLKEVKVELKSIRNQLASFTSSVITSAVAAALSAQNRG